MIQNRVIAEYEAERERSLQPGYVSRYDDYYDFEEKEATPAAPLPADAKTRVEPAEPKPRGPHQPPSTHKTPTEPDDSDGFGAGIL